MLALSWKQPFGTAMLFGKVETRSWYTKYRGPVLICTSKQAYNEATARAICESSFVRNRGLFEAMCVKLKGAPSLDLNGYAIAVGNLVKCRPMDMGAYTDDDEERSFVGYRNGLYMHFYENVRPIQPFPWKGMQGWKKVDQLIIDKIVYI